MGKEDDGPKRRDCEYCCQDRLGSCGLALVEDIVGELWGTGKKETGEEGERDLPDWRQRHRGRDASWPLGCGERQDWAQRGGIYIRNRTRRLGGGLLEGHGSRE